MTEPRHDEPDRGTRWSDTLRTRLEEARDSEAQRAWARWEAGALRELSKASLEQVSWEIAEGVRLPPLVDAAIDAVLASGLDRSAARGPMVRDPRRPWSVLRTRNASQPDETPERSAWERQLGVTRISLEAAHLDASALDVSSWRSVLADGLEQELRVGRWTASLAGWTDVDVIVDPVAAILATGGERARLSETREEALGEALGEEGDRVRFGVDARAMHEAGAGAVDEVAVVLAQVAAWLGAAARRGRSPKDVFTRLDVAVAIGREPLVEIAKLRAIRGAIAAMAEACGVRGDEVQPRVVAHGSHRELTRRDPWVNLLRGTMVGIAGVLGGVDALEIAPLDLLDDEHGEFGARMAIDTHRLLRDEAHLAATADAAGGSYAIEAATEAFACAAWQRFREIEAAGGFDAWLGEGGLHRTVEAGAASLVSRVRDGVLILLGSNLHPAKDVPAVPKGGWRVPAQRNAVPQAPGDVRPLVWISLESCLLESAVVEPPASKRGSP